MGFGKLGELITNFSRTWKVVERQIFLIGYGKALEFCLGSSKIS